MSKTLETYGKYPVSDVPIEKMKDLIKGFILDAAIDMGQKPDDIIYERVFEYITKDFGWMLCIQLASAFKRGALGQFGSGRLVPRTIYMWLTETRNELANRSSGAAEKIEIKKGFAELDRFPLGQAITKKIDWLTTRAITEETYDTIPLKKIAEIIRIKGHCSLEDIGKTDEL